MDQRSWSKYGGHHHDEKEGERKRKRKSDLSEERILMGGEDNYASI